MPDNGDRVGQGFDLLSGIYDRCVALVFGSELIALQEEIIEDLPTKAHCLIIGGGSGRILRSALDRSLANEFSYAELSENMLQRTRKRLDEAELKHVRFGKDWKALIASRPVDYIILPFILDCYSEVSVARLLGQLSPHMTEKAELIIVDFNEVPISGRRPGLRKRLFIRLLYFFFAVAADIEARSLPPILLIAKREGFQCQKWIGKRNSWLVASRWRMDSVGMAKA